jgi:hypothetical protein
MSSEKVRHGPKLVPHHGGGVDDVVAGYFAHLPSVFNLRGRPTSSLRQLFLPDNGSPSLGYLASFFVVPDCGLVPLRPCDEATNEAITNREPVIRCGMCGMRKVWRDHWRDIGQSKPHLASLARRTHKVPTRSCAHAKQTGWNGQTIPF